MTTTNTKTTTTRFPTWAGKAGLWAAIIVATQVPSLFRTAIAAGKASDRVCEMTAQGHSIPEIAKTMENDWRFNYPKRWEGFAKFVVTHNLKSCPSVASAIQTQR